MRFPYGTIVTTLPDGYAPRQQWPEYDAVAQVLPSMHPRAVGTAIKGIQWGLWPLMFEEYVSDTEPEVTSDGPNRIVIWQRLARRDRPRGWYQLSRSPARVEGFATVHIDYRKDWSESARRYVRKWDTEFLNKTYRIETVSFGVFKQAYRKSTVAKKAHDIQLDMIERMLANPTCAPHITLWGARNNDSDKLIAGLAVVDSPTHHCSYYQAGFIQETPDHAPAMIGLMDHWYKDAQAKQIHLLMFGGFWHSGLSKKVWGGFSAFKAKFGLQYIEYAPPLMQFKRGTFFRKI